jgi:hypothetical protein
MQTCYKFAIVSEHDRLMWVFSEFSVSTVPLAKCSNHFWVLQTQIVLDGQTNTQTIFAWKTPVRQCKGNNKKSWCFWTLCLSQLMRSRAVGIDKRQNGFVKLYLNSVCFVELFQSVFIGWDPPPAKLGAASWSLGPNFVSENWLDVTILLCL